MAAVVVAFEIGRGGFTAEVAIDALVVHVEFSGDVFWVFVSGVGPEFSDFLDSIESARK